MDNYLNMLIDNRYEIRELIGVGGMAIVYKAYDKIDDRFVAIKILKDEFIANEEFRRRFKNESRAIAVLNHPNVVKVYDVKFAENLQYIVMEYVDGITLKEYIKKQGVVDWKEAIHFIVQILRALQHAHDKGIIHRDIKPQNILLLPNATIKVTDFGIARFNRNESKNVYESNAIGSVHYVSPEQARGEYTDERSDLYSVGVVLFEMLTGRVPFDSESDDKVVRMQIEREPVKPTFYDPTIPIGLEQITLHALQKNASARYPSATAFLHDIDAFKRNPSIKFDYDDYSYKSTTKYFNGVPVNPEDDKEYVKPAKDKSQKDKNADENTVKDASETQDEYIEEDDEEEEVIKGRTHIVRIILVVTLVICLLVGGTFALVLGKAFKDYKSEAGTGSGAQSAEEDDSFIGKIVRVIDKIDFLGLFDDDNDGFFDNLLSSIDFLNIFDGKDGKIEVPNFINMTFEEVKTKYPNYIYQTEEELNSAYASGQICSQSPEPGAKISKNNIIKLTIARNGNAVLVPDVSGYSIAEAEETLKSSGFKVESVGMHSETVEEGKVINTSPAGNTYADYQKTVFIYYSSSLENANTHVPDVVGYQLAAAKAKIIDAGLKVGTVSYGASSKALKDCVISQTPTANTPVTSGIIVNLVVGNGVPSDNTSSFRITLPSFGAGKTCTLKLYLNGKAYDTITSIEANGGTYLVEFTGKGEANQFEIYADDTKIYQGSIDFTQEPAKVYDIRSYAVGVNESVPDVTGKSENDARDLLTAAGFSRISPQYVSSDTVPEGFVISQTPSGGTSDLSTVTTKVVLVISTGPEAVSEPPASGTEEPGSDEPTSSETPSDDPGNTDPTIALVNEDDG